MRALPLHLLLHCHRQLAIGPRTLCISALLGQAGRHRAGLPFLG